AGPLRSLHARSASIRPNFQESALPTAFLVARGALPWSAARDLLERADARQSHAAGRESLRFRKPGCMQFPEPEATYLKNQRQRRSSLSPYLTSRSPVNTLYERRHARFDPLGCSPGAIIPTAKDPASRTFSC